ncbi:florfenicol exporter [Fusarium albosuccineum]|uniref:Florfenicol exporter n=1 Tax=Fusarium albosuccineum TaxID=1237068 RepID=A0A8H4KG22_9HYPO|nr:florfenicol exporter [Fusarium albosuccineum]
MVTSSTTTALLRGYPFLNEWQIGLCFLPNGFGCVAGSLSTGWLLDKSFKSAEARYRAEHGIDDEQDVSKKGGFPLVFEFNDLRRQFTANLAAPLGLQFLIAFTATAIFNINSTLLIDCFPDRPASATALNNLCRCLLGAAGVSAIQPMIDTVKIMKAFLIVTGIVLASTPLVWVEWKWGEKWRREREKKLALQRGQQD